MAKTKVLEKAGAKDTSKSINQERDSADKVVFQDAELCAQFIRGYSKVSILKNVKAEDIEDVSERFVQLFAADREADTVKRIHLENGDPMYLISLIEHKTYVDYNVIMQILRYMVYIWEDYEKETKRLHDNDKEVLTSSQKNFRYPIIIPIVYYEGKNEWNAATHCRERIWMGEQFNKYIPDFTYELVQLNEFTNEELIQRKDEISLVMLFNKLQDMKDFDELKKINPKELEEIVKNTPEALLEIMAKVIRALFIKLNLSSEETDEMVGKLRERKVGQLFENFEKVDFQLERRLRAEAEEKAAEAEEKAAEAEEKAAEAEEKVAEYKKTIEEKDLEMEKVKVLTKKLFEASRQDDLLKSMQDEDYLKQLYQEFGIK